MALELGISQSLIYETDEGPTQTFAAYKLLNSISPTGDVFAAAKLTDLVISLDVAWEVLKCTRQFISTVISCHKITTKDRPDIPVEIRILESPPGMTYNIQMDTLDQDITWDSSTQEITIHAAQAYSISLEAFIYYMDSIEDLLNAVEDL